MPDPRTVAESPEREDPPPWKWRVGQKLGRTIYFGDILHGLIDTAAVAERVVEAMNEIGPLREENAKHKAETDRLRALLEEYGDHKRSCPAVPHRNHPLGPCTCGWESIAFEDPTEVPDAG